MTSEEKTTYVILTLPQYHKWDPWHWASKDQRDYITPEDITDAIDHDPNKKHRDFITVTVLHAMSKKAVEDWSLCAFVAVSYRGPRKKKTKKKKK